MILFCKGLMTYEGGDVEWILSMYKIVLWNIQGKNKAYAGQDALGEQNCIT